MEGQGRNWETSIPRTLFFIWGDSKIKCNGFLSKIDPFSEPSGGVAGSAVALRSGLSGLLPSWAKVFAWTCWTDRCSRALLTVRLYLCSTVSHFPFRHKNFASQSLLFPWYCIRGGEKKEKKKTSQSLYVEFKIVINRACWKKKLNNCCLFLYKREFMTKV